MRVQVAEYLGCLAVTVAALTAGAELQLYAGPPAMDTGPYTAAPGPCRQGAGATETEPPGRHAAPTQP
ncbi:hypothetical protein ACTWP5_06210 [Streptomyces sp. 4N509B]|uniref:hypothetical protein n=1 Tax=Streptomyces sp. 4N509B TaxID=3457413 RepID=UPI003FD1CD3B